MAAFVLAGQGPPTGSKPELLLVDCVDPWTLPPVREATMSWLRADITCVHNCTEAYAHPWGHSSPMSTLPGRAVAPVYRAAWGLESAHLSPPPSWVSSIHLQMYSSTGLSGIEMLYGYPLLTNECPISCRFEGGETKKTTHSAMLVTSPELGFLKMKSVRNKY